MKSAQAPDRRSLAYKTLKLNNKNTFALDTPEALVLLRRDLVHERPMTGLSRNAPCPCGSQKKYKRCCADKIIPFPGPLSSPIDREPEPEDGFRSNGDFREYIRNTLDGHDFASLEEVNIHLQKASQQFNTAPVEPFLGLTPEQMHRIIYFPFEFKNGVVELQLRDDAGFDQVPLMNQARYFLSRFREEGEIKATQKGNLPRALVRDLYEEFYKTDRYSFRPNSENDCRQAELLKFLLMTSGYVKKRYGKYSLTKSGEKILGKDLERDLFIALFMTSSTKMIWDYADHYPDFTLMQRSLTFNLLLLAKKAGGWISGDDLGLFYLDAFPALMRECHGGWEKPELEVIKAFQLRFLERFCVPMGILESETKGEILDETTYFKVTSFFLRNFRFLA